MEFYTAKFATATKTAEDFLASYDSDKPTQEVAEKAAEAFRGLDGIEVTVGNTFSGSYSLLGWKTEDDEKVRDFIYYAAEQDELFGSYVDEREEFLEDWSNEEYEPAGSIVFEKSDLVEIKSTKLQAKE